MCLAVPAKILSIEGLEAEVEFGGIHRTISIQLMPDVQVGQYVLVHTGFAIGVVDEKEALETLELLKQMGDLEPISPEEAEPWRPSDMNPTGFEVSGDEVR